MRNTKKKLKEKQVDRIYLLTGTEPYLISDMKKLFFQTICDGNKINFVSYTDPALMPKGKDLCRECCNTPFFGKYRLIMIDECMKADDDFINFIPSIPETTVIVIVDTSVDKRSKLYKAIQKNGTICNCIPLETQEIREWIAKKTKKLGAEITAADAEYLMDYVGTDMNCLLKEIQKLVISGEAINKKSISKYCYPSIENKIFQMIENAISGNTEIAMKQYEDLILLQESPFKILTLIVRQLRIIMLVNAMSELKNEEIALKVGIPVFAVKKAKNKPLPCDQARIMLEKGLDYLEQIKAGYIKDSLACDLLLCQL